MKINTVLIDMGGVLLDLENSKGLPPARLDWRGREALLRLLRQRNQLLNLEDLETLLFEPWRREYERRYELGTEASWKPHLTSLRRAAGSRLHDVHLLRSWFRPYAERIKPYQGISDTLHWLKRHRLKLALVSNVPLPGALYLRILDRHGIAGVFDSIHFSYDCGSRKPSPAMLRDALAVLQSEPGDSVMVGDRRASDIAAGRAAGVATVWIRSEDGGGPAPDFAIDSLAALPALIEEKFRGFG
ncbi:MAG: HAD family hydrolase [Thermoanaerobaculia bacterium]